MEKLKKEHPLVFIRVHVTLLERYKNAGLKPAICGQVSKESGPRGSGFDCTPEG